jgi:hypothetical protein
MASGFGTGTGTGTGKGERKQRDDAKQIVQERDLGRHGKGIIMYAS